MHVIQSAYHLYQLTTYPTDTGGVGHLATQLAAKVGKARRVIGVASATNHEYLRCVPCVHIHM